MEGVYEMKNEEPLQNNVEDKQPQENQPEDAKPVPSRRAFAVGLASIGAAAVLASKAEGQNLTDGEIKKKILQRIKTDLANNDVSLTGYDKVGGHYAKSLDEVPIVSRH
jgi:hypothetical protein